MCCLFQGREEIPQDACATSMAEWTDLKSLALTTSTVFVGVCYPTVLQICHPLPCLHGTFHDTLLGSHLLISLGLSSLQPHLESYFRIATGVHL